MKNILLVIMASLVFGCAEEAKKAEAPKDAKGAAVKAAPVAAKKTVVKAGFADEDISKKKLGQAGEVTESSVSCKGTGDDVRTIAVVKEGGGCKVDYTKSGATQTIASAAADFNYCQERLDKVRGNLEAAGFKCE